MSDQAQFYDLSGLWGPDDIGLLTPAPARGFPAEDSGLAISGGLDRNGECTETGLGALEEKVPSVGEQTSRTDLDVLRAELFAALSQQFSGIHARLEARLDARLGTFETRIQDGLQEVTLMAAAANTALAGRMTAIESEVRRFAPAEATPERPSTKTELEQRLAATERRTALLADSIQAYRSETARDLGIAITRADLQAAADEIAARTDDDLTQRFHELAGHLTQTVALDALTSANERIDALGQRLVRLTELLESHRIQSVMGWELESLRDELIGAVNAQLVELRLELGAALSGSEVEAERHRLA